MKFISPTADQVFTATAAPAWPSVAFQTDGTGPHTWQWTLAWGSFSKTGTATTPDNKWEAQQVIANCGGTLSVVVKNGSGSATLNVKICGTNPTPADVNAYLATRPEVAGFERIVAHESRYRQFKVTEPLKSFDNGYGLTQLTDPAPTFEQAWNWKLNLDGGVDLFLKKRQAAAAYLGQSGRTYTPDQLLRETVCRWNGGGYHEWDAAAGKWVRSPSILCDSATGNIGWDMKDPANTGKSEADLHKRDSPSYSKPPVPAVSHWKYLGICYADAILR